MTDSHIEIERKFLIKRPDIEIMQAAGAVVSRIKQTYLTDNEKNGAERRVRRISSGGKIRYIKTEKKKITDISRTEEECELSHEEYLLYYNDAVSELTKTRYAIPYGGHIIEIDIYPKRIGGSKMDGLAVMEIELEAEDERFVVPEWIAIVRELTGKREFSNKVLAKPVK